MLEGDFGPDVTLEEVSPRRAGWNYPGRLKIPKDLIIFACYENQRDT